MNRNPYSPLCALAGAIIIISICASHALADMSLVWSDEFNGASLNPDNWTADIGNGCPDNCGWGNNELEFYRAENVTVSDGNLILTTLDQYYAGYHYTSGKVHTRDKQFFRYGRYEMRAKLPTGGGMWPAFWMMPQYDVYGGWAASGEIDIMESANNTTEVGGALHFGGSWPENTHTSGSISLGGESFADEFHIYAVEWEADVIRWYVDDILFATRTSDQWYTNTAPENPQAPFDQDFYIILNSAIGGNYTGCIEPECITADLPQQFLIDYVRVYQNTSNVAPTVTITSPASGDNPPVGDLIINATASDADGVVATVEFYNGSEYLGEDTTAPYSFTWASVPDGCYDIIARATDDNGSFGTDTVDVTVGAGCGQEPFLGSPFALPTKIEVEDFDIGGEGIAYHDIYPGNNGGQYRPDEDVDIETCYDAGGGYGVGWVSQGEWLEYTVNVPVTGQYTIETRISSLSGGGIFHLEFGGVDKTGDIDVPVTGGWQTWASVFATATLESGTQTMRFAATTDGFNINYFDILAEVTAVSSDLQQVRCELLPCFPNPFNPTTSIRYDVHEPTSVSLSVYDVKGQLIRTLVAAETVSAGRYEVIWNGDNAAGQPVAAGVYFCRLQTEYYWDTVRMTLVK